MQIKVAVAGLGVVGSNLARLFQLPGRESKVKYVGGYDPPKGHADEGPLAEADIVFVCVPTPYVDGMGFSAIHVMDAVEAIPGRKIIAIRSTLQPGTTDEFQQIFLKHKFLHIPEFLSEDTAWEDTCHPTRCLVGYTKESESEAARFFDILPPADYPRAMPAIQAEISKCVSNSFYAVKVAFANQVFDFCRAKGVPYEGVRQALEAEPMLGASHWKTPHKGYRGYGGKCLPKDIRTTILAMRAAGVAPTVLEAAENYNNWLTLVAPKPNV